MGADAVALDTERRRRWRLVLGQPAEEATGISLDAADMGMDRVLEALFGRVPKRSLDAVFDGLADCVEEHLDCGRLRELAGVA